MTSRGGNAPTLTTRRGGNRKKKISGRVVVISCFALAVIAAAGTVIFAVRSTTEEARQRREYIANNESKVIKNASIPGRSREEGAYDNDKYHLVFSTDCGAYQRWQSYLMFSSALTVKQPGRVTRIASGCTDEEAADEKAWHEEHVQGRMSSRFGLHLTPHFSKVKDENGEETGKRYDFFNKPFGVRHWMENGEGMGINPATGSARNEDLIVILIDPDQILLSPITENFENDHIFHGGQLDGQKVKHGSPFASKYGFGSDWLRVKEVAGPDSPVLAVSRKEAAERYPAGPPYVATAKDFYPIAVKWTEYVPLVHKIYPHLLAEMYAYCLAAAHLNLPHQIVSTLMVSDTTIGTEGWPLLEDVAADKMCQFGTDVRKAGTARTLPSVLHYCQRYMLGKHFFGKRRLPKDFLTCEKPLLIMPPFDVGAKYDYRIPPPPHRPPGEKKPVPQGVAKREAFMLCAITQTLNDAARFFKHHACQGKDANLGETLDLWDVKDMHTSTGRG
mmetsp:Transcript_32788/g.48109  ORF Transcript_32788/g.48109 Transcript_32788/m.48109 type:complete len:503 (+) Transcript_32788:77-1585(+)|eukprot:CAMPEP_0195515434 /NCGR_PEP_ID=MMETSP0794_2-20130614/6502_1 /TAXON_ID=515487 /ORGANISM="Stephanopyxis turris, Strain CCMP 815" /LENGTH=502 /DNA_ID=CAMNT_0040643853 /DNA_START=76 /DNA_END=1584 /DNA_ORIENTATION=-